MPTLRDRVETPQGNVLVITKTRFYLFFQRPRTYVLPEGFSEFGRQRGFQARYNTVDPQILAEFHGFFVARVAAGHFSALLEGAKTGFMEYLPGFEHLKNYLIGFNI